MGYFLYTDIRKYMRDVKTHSRRHFKAYAVVSNLYHLCNH